MKKTLPLLLTFTLCLGIGFAQTNMDLELWAPNGAGGEDPNGWGTLNGFMFLGAPQTTWKDTITPGEGLTSAKLESINFPGATGFGAPSDTVGAMLSIGGPVGFGPLGIPYTQKPASVDFLYKANPLGYDMGVVVVELSHWDGAQTVTDGQGFMTFSSQVNTWTPASICVSYFTGDTPDTLKIMAASSAVMLGLVPVGLEMPGSQLFLDDFVINLPGALTVAITGLANVDGCNGDCNGAISVTAIGAPSYTYSWSNGDTTDTADSLCAGMYTVIVTDGNGDKACAVAPITEPPALTATLSSTDETAVGANDGTASVTASGGTGTLTYLWSPGGATTNSITGLVPDTYTVTVTDSSNCTFTDSVVVNAFSACPTPTASFTFDTTGSSASFTNTSTTTGTTSWAWTFGDTNIDATQNPTHTYSSSGTYNVCLVLIDSCGTATFCDSVTVTGSVGISELFNTESVRIYPNPVVGELNIVTSFNEETAFYIFDMVGRQIKSLTIIGELNRVNISNLSTGMYMYQVKDKSGALLSNGNFTVIE